MEFFDHYENGPGISLDEATDAFRMNIQKNSGWGTRCEVNYEKFLNMRNGWAKILTECAVALTQN